MGLEAYFSGRWYGVPSVPPHGEEAAMTASGLLRERDLRLLTAVIEDGLRDDPGEAMPWAFFDRLLQLIPADDVQLDELDLQGQKRIFQQGIDDAGERCIDWGNHAGFDDPRFWELRHSFLPCSYSARTGDLVSVTRWSDFCTAAELRRAPWYAEYLAPECPPVKYAISVPLPTLPGRTRYLWFARVRRDFSEQERLALQLLRPHLQQVYLDAERRRNGIPQLSRRELEVLQLASQGYSNADIARILFISVSTVRKHMEHIFDRTGVRTRAAAAALALPRVSLATPRAMPTR
jgi:DNA-binding CsgD family transcriptional regulator